MEIRNHTPFADGLAIGLGPDREPCLSVIVKGTYAIPEQSSDAVDPVSLRVGRRLHNVVRVFGDRKWVFPTRVAAVPRMTDTAPFVEMPLIYERAFGGMDYKSSAWCPRNFVGRGFIGNKTKEAVDRTPLPNLEDPNDLISSWDDEPRPVGFGFYRKDWQPRAGCFGTEDGQEEADEEFRLPSDFQFDFYNAAHPYLQIEGYLQGDEEIELRHFTPDEYRRFSLPGIKPTVRLERYEGPRADASPEADLPGTRTTQTESVAMNLDTFVLLPDEGEFYLVWRGRTSLPEKKLDDMDFSEFAAIDVQLDSG